MHEGFSEAPHTELKILKIFLWHIDTSGYLEPLNCEYCNYFASFRVFSFVSCIYYFWLFGFLLLQVADQKKTFCPKLDLGPGG